MFSFVFLPFGLFFFLRLFYSLRPRGPPLRAHGATRGAGGGLARGAGLGCSRPLLLPDPRGGEGDSWKRNFHFEAAQEQLFKTKKQREREQGFWSPRSPHHGSRDWGVSNPDCFCSRTEIRADGPMDAFLMPTTSVRFQQLRFNATTLQNGVSPLIFYSFRIWAHDFSGNHPHSSIN